MRWFADIDDREPESSRHRWAPFIQVAGAVHQLGGVWFSSEEDCEQFINEEILK